MKHYIIVKFNETVTDKVRIGKEVLALFSELKGKNGIHDVQIKMNCISRDNRFDLMIIVDMDKEALSFYDESEQHKKWKKDYSCYILNKAIFDSEN